ncbi:MAG: UvrABC system protein B [Candidatus Woesebacteria bacterium GW2011_GWA1_39_21]|uniref:UvrABC system protein B n=1 Tax=Candidatus Woesebacteria bacterium GW2011_GWA1_39_21 TaxID=1618550 RepID=A0A0G0N7W1_9BACT|nr:MAG: UvrABC system protein B [Candidatus Woesebacteria bacterium GW2011_GWA1_39_21]
MNNFKLHSTYKPIDDQKRAIAKLCDGIKSGRDYQVLLGVTGSGKTFTVANVIEKLQVPTLIISHNKTLAGQLYQEFRDFFPGNAVSYFVSYYDYYQPEAYIPSTDTYIEKDSDINDLIDKLRLSTTTNLLTRPDTIVIASVSCIYNLGSPVEYRKTIFEFTKGMKVARQQILDRLVSLQYERGDYGFHRGTFRVRGNVVDVYPSYQDEAVRINIENDYISEIEIINPIDGTKVNNNSPNHNFTLFPAKHYVTDRAGNGNILTTIEKDMRARVKILESSGKILEAHRLKQKVSYDLGMIKELGYVKGIENYSRYFDGRNEGDPPYSLIDYFNIPYGKKWLLVVDESHMTFPQIRGMYHGDLSRKKTLIDYGFRLPSALDNRPLKFEEFVRRIPNFIATSATPAEWEITQAIQASNKHGGASNGIVEQLIRPTGIPDPLVEIKPTTNQVSDVMQEIVKESKAKRRTLVTTLTKKTAEDLTEYLKEKGLAVHYLHSDVDTLERTDILDDLRLGKYDCIIGVNLLREGLDLPEVALVAILDADKEGFLRSDVSLVQTMGRAARHVKGRVILYADKITKSIEKSLNEVSRRRALQVTYNKKHHITPRSIKKPIREKIITKTDDSQIEKFLEISASKLRDLDEASFDSLTPLDKKKLVNKLKKEMKIAAEDLNFEFAAQIRDKIKFLEIS